MNLPVFVGALFGSAFDFLEVAVIAYALAGAGHPREAVRGTAAGMGVVGIGAVLFGSRLAVVPLRPLQIASGLVLLWLGAKWTLKSVERLATRTRAGWIQNPLRRQEALLRSESGRFNYLSFAVMFKGAALETCEVALVILAFGSGSGAWAQAWAGTVVAFALTVGVTAVLHGRLRRIPDRWLKLAGGLLLLTFGTFWLGNGAGLRWPLRDLTLPLLFLAYGAASCALAGWRRGRVAGVSAR